MNAGASTHAVPSPIEGSGTAWVLLGSWALSLARPTPIHPRRERRGLSALLVNQALAMAIWQRQPAAGLIMHTDRGSQYGADSYRQLLTQHGMQPSMSRKGNCWDNAVAESFFHTLKTEMIFLEDFDTHEQAKTAVFEYIEVFYNRQRCHLAKGYLAPLAYEQALKTNEILCPEKC